jgi:hypothetical protein
MDPAHELRRRFGDADVFKADPIVLHVYADGKETPVDAPELLPDDSIGDVSRKLAVRLGTPVYWCVRSDEISGSYLDSLRAAAQDAEIAVHGPREKGRKAKASDEFAHWCPYAVGGHPAALPDVVTAVKSDAVLEQMLGSSPDARVVACIAPSAAWNAPETPDDGTEAVLDAMRAATPFRERMAGACDVEIVHSLTPDGTPVTRDVLDSFLNGTKLSTDGVFSATLHRANGSLTFRGWAPAARAGALSATKSDRDCRRLLSQGVEQLLLLTAVPGVEGAARVRIDPEMVATVSLHTAGDALDAIRGVFDTPAVRDALRSAADVDVEPVPVDALDVQLVRYRSRHVLTDSKGSAPALAAFVTALDRASPLLSYTRTPDGLEITLARTPNYTVPTPEHEFIMRRQHMALQGRRAQLLKELAAEFRMTPEGARAELAAYEASRPMRVYRDTTLPSNNVLATVKSTGPDGLMVTIDCRCELRYAERLMWCLRRVMTFKRGTVAAVAAKEGASVQELLRAAQEASPADEASKDASAVSSKYVLNRLYATDRDLFASFRPKFQMYSKMCGAVDGRQPIALTPKALAELRESGQDLYSVETRGVAYVCPQVWCPVLQTSMTVEDFVAAGSVCPDGTPGIDMTRAKYWRGAPARYPGFLGAHKHPDGLCMPCCFKRPQTPEQQSRSGTPDQKTPSSKKDQAYVLSEDHVPLPENRYGASRALPDMLRRGVPGSTFMAALAAVLGRSVDAVVSELVSVATTANLLRVGRGGLLSRFTDVRHAPLREDEFAAFLKTAAGKAHVAATATTGSKLAGAARERSRALFDAVLRYREYLAQPQCGHAFVLPLLPVAFPDTLVGVVEVTDSVAMVHAPMGGAAPLPSVTTVRLIHKQDAAYEPLVSKRTKGAALRPGDHEAAMVVSAHLQYRDILLDRPLARLLGCLKARSIQVDTVVLADDLRTVGVVTKDDLYVPLEEPDESAFPGPVDMAYISDLPAAGLQVDAKAAVDTLAAIAKDTGRDDLLDPEHVKSRGRTVALRTKAGAVVPLASDAPEILELYRDARDAVVQFVRSAPAGDSPVSELIADSDALQRLLDDMRVHLQNEHLDEMWVLNHPMCPYPRDVRAARLLELTSPVHSDVSDDVVAKAINMLMTRQTLPNAASSQVSDVVVANEDDVIDGTLAAAVAALSLPEDHVDVVRRALATQAYGDPVSSFSESVSLTQAWAAPARGLEVFKTPGVVDPVAAVAAIASATGVRVKGTTHRYVQDAVRDIATAAELGESVQDMGLHYDVERLALSDIEKAKTKKGDIVRRLTTRLLTRDHFHVGPGDVARALSGPKNVAVVLSPKGSFVSGSGDMVTVVMLFGSTVAIATKERAPQIRLRDLPKGVATLVNSHLKQFRARQR